MNNEEEDLIIRQLEREAEEESPPPYSCVRECELIDEDPVPESGIEERDREEEE